MDETEKLIKWGFVEQTGINTVRITHRGGQILKRALKVSSGFAEFLERQPRDGEQKRIALAAILLAIVEGAESHGLTPDMVSE